MNDDFSLTQRELLGPLALTRAAPGMTRLLAARSAAPGRSTAVIRALSLRDQ